MNSIYENMIHIKSRHKYPNYGAASGATLLVIFLANIWNIITVNSNQVQSKDFHGSWSGFAPQNVSCIAHDTKFTCDCQNMNQPMVLPHLMGYAFQVEIRNCQSLTIDSDVIKETQGLKKIAIRNVKNLVLNEKALAFPQHSSNIALIIEFENVNFEIIDSHAIDGNIEEISFIGGRINVIHAFGLTTRKDRAMLLKMENVFVQRIEPQAFKKFAVEQMEIKDCIFDFNVPSKAFYELEVLNTLRIHNVHFKEVHSHAFSFKMITELIITNNYFGAVDGEWIEGFVSESVKIRDNYFGNTSPIAFKGIKVHRDYARSEPLELRFINNTVHFPLEPRALEFSDNFTLNLKQLQYENIYSCKDVDMQQKPPKPKIVFFRTFADSIYFRRGDQDVTSPPKQASGNIQSFVVLSKLIEWDCQPRSYWLYILLGVLGLVLILLIVIVVVCLHLAKKRKRRKMDVVMPEPRTYKETQIVYQIENAGLLKTDL